MGRRSDHSRAELEAMILGESAALIAEGGLAGFSAREVARRVGYSIGTIHNLFGTSDRLVAAVNTRSFGLWADALRARLAGAPADTDARLAALVEGYFAFAHAEPGLWSAIFDHRLPGPDALPPADREARGLLTDIVAGEVATALGRAADDAGAAALARSLIATVHGHCAMAMGGAWALMADDPPEAAALARVREAVAGQG